jgi:hypothetical protein
MKLRADQIWGMPATIQFRMFCLPISSKNFRINIYKTVIFLLSCMSVKLGFCFYGCVWFLTLVGWLVGWLVGFQWPHLGTFNPFGILPPSIVH